MANVNAAAERVLPQAGADSGGRKVGFLNGVTKAAATDTITVTNANNVEFVAITNDTSGALDPATDITTNVITLSVGTGTVSGIILYN